MSDVSATTGLGDYVRWLADRGHTFASYEELWRWSIDDLEGFWASVWDYFEVKGSYERVLGSRDMPGAEWFPGARLNYAEHMLGRPEDRDTARGDRVLADPRAERADLRRARRPGRPGPRRARPARRRARRPGRRVRAEHPRGAGRVPGLRLAGRDLGLLRARVRGAQRRRPLRPDRAHRPDRGRRLHLRRQGDRQVRRGRGDPEGAADAAPRRRHRLRAPTR